MLDSLNPYIHSSVPLNWSQLATPLDPHGRPRRVQSGVPSSKYSAKAGIVSLQLHLVIRDGKRGTCWTL